MELERDAHSRLSDSAGPTLILNICHTAEQKVVLVSTRGKQFHHCSAPSWWKLFQEKREYWNREKEEARRQEREKETRAAMRPYSLTPKFCGEQTSEKKSWPLSPLKAPSLGCGPNIDPCPFGQFFGKEQEVLVEIEEASLILLEANKIVSTVRIQLEVS